MKLTDLIAPSFYELHKDIKQEKHDEYWLKGGRGSTKSTFISIEIILGIIKHKDANAVITRRFQNELRDTVYGQFEWTIYKMGLEHFFKFQVSPMQIIYMPTGQKIVFKAADNPKKIKSINLGHGYIKYAWFEEIDQFNNMQEIRNILQSLFRGGNQQKISFYSFNPPKSNRSWVNQEVSVNAKHKKIHHSTYLDVPKEWLGQTFIAKAEHLKDVNYTAYQHEYLGETVGTGLEVFNNVTLKSITDEEINMFDNIRQGLDFGYAVDPLAFNRLHYDKKKRRIYVFKEISGINLFNRQFAAKLTDEEKRHLTLADKASPKDIEELKQDYGLNIRGADKPPGSREHGMKFLQDLEEIIIDPDRCPRAAREFINYSLELDRHGEIKSKFPDKDDHTIDGIRYALSNDMKQRDIIFI